MRQRSLLVAFGILGGIGVAIACGDPYDGEIPDTTAPVRDAAAGDEETSTTPPDDGGVDVAKDAGADVDPCDRDNDGFIAVACDGGDCDDDDDRVHPDASFVPGARDGGSGDFNCDTVVSKQFETNVTCAVLLGTCNRSGFKVDPPCGTAGEFITCGGSAPSCSIVMTEQKTQGCR